MRRITCDKCRKEQSEFMCTRWIATDERDENGDTAYKEIDLCSDCSDEFDRISDKILKDWLSENKQNN